MTRTPTAPGSDSFNEVCTMRIELADSDPLIWRKLDVPTSLSLKAMHEVIQAAMGWFDMHPWEFRIDGQPYGLPTDEDWGTEPRREATKTRLRDVLKPRRTRLDYIYDFGDEWLHHITINSVRAGDPELRYPRYIAGERNAPPEDCGGMPGFYAALAARADPDDPDHDHMVEWLDGYDPDALDELQITISLGRIANRRNAARARLAKKT
jgi:hypothetical protein